MAENCLNLFYLFCCLPQFPLWVFEAVCLYFLNFVHRVLLVGSPLELLLKEVEDHEVQTPKIISA